MAKQTKKTTKRMEELKTSSDFAQERDMIKGKLREMFALYQ